MDQLKQFSNAILQGAGGANGFQSAFGLDNWINPAMDRVGKGIMGNSFAAAAGAQADEEEKRRQAAAKEQEAQVNLMNDPSKYQQLRKDDGGFAFFDPAGKEIDIDAFAKKTGQRRIDILKDSENPIDQQFIRDFDMTDLVSQAIYQNDTETLQGLAEDHPEVFKSGATQQGIMEELMRKYPHIYGRGSYEQTLKNASRPLFNQSASRAREGRSAGTGGLNSVATASQGQ